MLNKEKVAGLIIASAKKDGNPFFNPLLEIGGIPIIKRIILTFQQSDVSPIVIVIEKDNEDLKRSISNMNVVFLENDELNLDMFSSAKIGLKYLKDRCNKVIFTPVHIPMFTIDTIRKLIDSHKKIVAPNYKGSGGHPLLIYSDLIEDILNYTGNGGMEEAIRNLPYKREFIEVDDIGVLYGTYNKEQFQKLLQFHNKQIFHPFVKISLEKEDLLLDEKGKLLLMLIRDMNSVSKACNHMSLSYSKAWKILNHIEERLGYPVVSRKQGGSFGGKTVLTEKGNEFLEKYIYFEEKVKKYAREEFEKIFLNS